MALAEIQNSSRWVTKPHSDECRARIDVGDVMQS